MAQQQFANAARSALAVAIGAADTALTLKPGEGARFPPAQAGDYWWWATLEDADGIEIVQVTGRTADTLSVARGQQGTVARAFAAGSVVGLRLTAADAQTWNDGCALANQAAGAANGLSARASPVLYPDPATEGRVLTAGGGNPIWGYPYYPTAGPGNVTLTRAGGVLTGVSATVDGKPMTMTLTRAGDGTVASVQTVFNGKTRTDTLARDGAGVLTGITSTEMSA